MAKAKSTRSARPTTRITELESATLRLAGDSGDGIQLAGMQFTRTSALQGNAVSVLPDFPAEIRAPAGSLAGVSGFQVQFSKNPIHTPGDRVHTLLAMNPAALRVNLPDLEPKGILLLDSDSFDEENLRTAGYDSNPLEDGSLDTYRVIAVPLTSRNRHELATSKNNSARLLSPKEQDRCRNFFALGLLYRLYQRNTEPTKRWIESTFSKNIEIREANIVAMQSGYTYADRNFDTSFQVGPAPIAPGRYRKVTGNEAIEIGLIAASTLAETPLLFCTAPNPAVTDLFQLMAERVNYEGIHVLQAEDEMAAMGAVLGASFGGTLGVTVTSGPGLGLGAEAMNLGVMTELPLVVIDIQRAGPSTGLPTKTEQSDLFQALHGRQGEAPVVVLAASSPADCFDMTLEAVRLAVEFMTPVILLIDSYLTNGAEPWRVPEISELPGIAVAQVKGQRSSAKFLPYARDDRLVRPWAVPGTPGREHRIGGLEKEAETGNVSYDPKNHAHMVATRQRKIANVASAIPELEVEGESTGEVLILGWGATYGSIHSAVQRLSRDKRSVGHAHLRYLHPFPSNLGDILARFDKVLVPELNTGQLASLIRAEFLVDVVPLNNLEARPFLVNEIYDAVLPLTKKKVQRRGGESRK